MKTKKIVSIILAIVMIVGLLPMSAIAESGIIGKVIGNTFVDKNAVPEKSYQYTVRGDDGSTQVVTVAGKDFKTGNTATKLFSKGDVYYVRAAEASAVKGNQILIVYSFNNTHYAMSDTLTDISENTNKIISVEVNAFDHPNKGYIIKDAHPNEEWTIGGSGDIRNFKNAAGKWISMYKTGNYGAGRPTNPTYFHYGFKLSDSETSLRIQTHGNQMKIWNTYAADHNWGVDYKSDACTLMGNTAQGVTITRESKKDEIFGGATGFHLYTRVDVDDDEFTIDTTELEKLIKSTENLPYIDVVGYYQRPGWDNFKAALAEAENAVAENKGKIYIGQSNVDNALDSIDQKHLYLKNMIDALVVAPDVGVCVTPEITWERTNDERDVVKGITNIDENDINKIIWEWDKGYDDGKKIKDLPTDPTVPVWNYTKDGVSAASWSKHGSGNWKISSAIRFSGTFTWPQGYDFNDKAVIESKNDANYEKIYQHINADPELKERYGDSKVFAVNDNMYVFISKADEQPSQWTAEDALKRLVFWTGTDGKGIWTYGSGLKDWGRTTPATFHGMAATPAFHEYMPTNRDINHDDKANCNKWVGLGDVGKKMSFSEEWYSLVDTSSAMSTLKELYGVNEPFGGQKMKIEVFAFDNSRSGGMDEPIIRICKPTADDVTVKINYWLDQVNGTSLGTTTKFTTDNAVINLPAGTNANELNYKRGAAVIAAGAGADVSLGVQQEENFVAHKGHENIINVVYTSNVKNRTYFTYDFAMNNRFEYTDTNPLAIKSARVEGIADATVNKVSDHKVYIDYKPGDSFGHVLNGEIIIERTNNEVNRYPIAIIPASNVYYEEDFLNVKSGKGADWALEGTTNNTNFVTDNETSVFGYTSLYSNKKGDDPQYHATVYPNGDQRFTDEIKFSFRGNGFDIISTASDSAGTLVVKVKNRDTGKTVKNYMINTNFKDSSIGSLNGVPVLHCEGLDAGVYDVSIKGAYVSYEQKNVRRSYSLLSTKNSMNDNSPYAVLAEMGFTDEEINNTEYINMENYVGSRTFSLRNSKDAPTTYNSAPATMQVYVDAIRVYRSTKGADKAYPANEANIIYNNILDAQESNFTAYMESQTDGKYGVVDYRKFGGPANELYLKPGGAVAIAVDPSIGETQISVRCVTGNGTQMKVNEGSEPILISHNAEMYYKVTTVNGVIVIANVGSSMLAIGNVKAEINSINDKQKTRAVMMMNKMMSEPVPEIFEPTKLNVKISVIKGLFSNYAVIRTTTSSDVASIEIDGVKYRARNTGLVNIGLVKNKKFVTKIKFAKEEPIVVNVTAYDKNGNASETVVKSK